MCFSIYNNNNIQYFGYNTSLVDDVGREGGFPRILYKQFFFSNCPITDLTFFKHYQVSVHHVNMERMMPLS